MGAGVGKLVLSCAALGGGCGVGCAALGGSAAGTGGKCGSGVGVPTWRFVLSSTATPAAVCSPHPPGREKLEEGEQVVRCLHKQLASAEQEAASASAAATAAAEGTAGSAAAEHAATLLSEAAALRQRCLQAGEEVAALRQEVEVLQMERAAAAGEAASLRQQLQQRDAEVAQLRLQVGGTAGHDGLCQLMPAVGAPCPCVRWRGALPSLPARF